METYLDEIFLEPPFSLCVPSMFGRESALKIVPEGVLS